MRLWVVLSAGALACAPAFGCESCKLKKAGLYLGETTLIGNGTVYSWVRYGPNHKPMSVGVTFTETALDGLHPEPPAGTEMPGYEYRLALPKDAPVEGFDNIGVDWNPRGHIPPGIYDVPHFDFHFYSISTAQRDKITAVGADIKRCDRPVPKQYQPDRYFLPPGTHFPKMGSHWIDATTPELSGQPFTHTLIYGSYDGKWIFIEPMVTKAFLETKPDIMLPIVPLKSVQKHGWYPTKYVIRYNEQRKEYTVALTGLVHR